MDTNNSLTARAVEFWNRHATSALTDTEAREAATNVLGFFDTLARWDRMQSSTDGHPTEGR